MDLLHVVFDWLFTRPIVIRPRRCKVYAPDGNAAYCRPSRKYSTKQKFKRVCPFVEPSVLNPLTLRECLCTENAKPEPIPAEQIADREQPAPETTTTTAESAPAVKFEVTGDKRLNLAKCVTTRGPGEWVTAEALIHNTTLQVISYASLELEYLDASGEKLANNLTIVGRVAANETKRVKFSKKVPQFESLLFRFRNVLSE